MARRDTDQSWDAPENLLVWNYDCLFSEGEPAKQFESPITDSINYAELVAAEVALHFAEHPVYLINISRGETGIKQWTSPEAGPSMMSALKINIAVALSKLGLEKIDALLWWGHESDASDEGALRTGMFGRHLNQVIEGLDKEPWAKGGSFPIAFHKINPKCHRFAPTINHTLEQLAVNSPDRISVFDTNRLSYADDIHLDASEKFRAAEGVFRGQYLVNAQSTHSRKNLLSRTALNAESISIAAGESLEVMLPTKKLVGRVVTFSMVGNTAPMRVVVAGVGYYFSAEETIQFQPFYIHHAWKDSLRLALIPLGEHGCHMGEVKLELGHGSSLNR